MTKARERLEREGACRLRGGLRSNFGALGQRGTSHCQPRSRRSPRWLPGVPGLRGPGGSAWAPSGSHINSAHARRPGGRSDSHGRAFPPPVRMDCQISAARWHPARLGQPRPVGRGHRAGGGGGRRHLHGGRLPPPPGAYPPAVALHGGIGCAPRVPRRLRRGAGGEAPRTRSHSVGDADRCSVRSVIEHGGHPASEAGRSTSRGDERHRTMTPGRGRAWLALVLGASGQRSLASPSFSWRTFI